MIFHTYWFLAFVGAVLPVYWLLPQPRPRRLWLLAVCLVFHAQFAGAAGMAPILVLGIAVYGVGLVRDERLAALGIAACVVFLLVYKFPDFVCLRVIGLIHPQLGGQLLFGLNQFLPATPPLGVSFFVFEFVHYLYEVRLGRPPIRAPLDFALFILFFPSLVAGPIKRYHDFLPSLGRGLAAVSDADVADGLRRVALGFVKKLVVADNLTILIDAAVPQYESLTLAARWGLLAAIGIRILADFSGYSDIAIGLARMLGVRLPENFNWPYVATSLRDFWQRWHISLSSWIRDYVYVPMGGGRRGPLRRSVNALVAFAIFGLWHGPEWHFLAFGLLHGVGLALSVNYPRLLGPLGRHVEDLMAGLPWLSCALTVLFFWLSLLLFFYPVGQALVLMKGLVRP